MKSLREVYLHRLRPFLRGAFSVGLTRRNRSGIRASWRIRSLLRRKVAKRRRKVGRSRRGKTWMVLMLSRRKACLRQWSVRMITRIRAVGEMRE